ncbi:hypothetical protein [Microvirga puerhi]|uniref:Histidine kinase N-terminal 7TM region domain-containing protein n=1 Tax=Microvirga puerhi TaxID=2876078 RepID=A0ABS7VU82_9HYPH|nr:hypothetical protein [Microvirga puerhi]MBZ6079115.1 hypothetical protein [Microvirga puerhi]
MLNARQIVSLITPAIFLLFSASFLVAWLVDRERKRILLFSVSLLLYGAAAVYQIMGIPADFGLSAMISASIYVVSSSFLVEGILRRIGKRYHQLLHVLFFITIRTGIYFYYYVDRSLKTRIYILNFGIGAFFVVTAMRVLDLRSGKLPDRILFGSFGRSRCSSSVGRC